MNCFSHRDFSAIAVCKGCGRAVCENCASDLQFAIVCSERCKIETTEAHEMSNRAKRLYGIGAVKKQTPMAPMIWLLLAAPFLYLIARNYYQRGDIDWFPVIFVFSCAVIGVLQYRRTKNLQLNC